MLAPSVAIGGAWTQPLGQGQIIETLYGWGGAGAPYGGALSPKENKLGAQTYVEYGLADWLTGIVDLGGERFALSPPAKDAFVGLDYSGVGARTRVWSNDAWVFAIEADAAITNARDASRPAENGNTGPEADARALFGGNLDLFGARAFVDFEAGYRWRTQGPPDEIHADATLGADLTERVKVLAQSFNTISNGSGAPGFAASENHLGQVSLVYALDPNWSLQIGGFGTLFRRNANSEFGGLVAIWRRF